jgi:glyoxylase-like metal-dependent hydrolase (beta-lactamase superfamily II)
MITKWMRHVCWQPFESFCRRSPLVPFKLQTTTFDTCIVKIQVDNLLTKAIARLGGGYDYSVCYLIDNALLIDTGFPWARKSLRRYLLTAHAGNSLQAVVNTHAHEDHVGNNDLIEQVSKATLYAHPLAVGAIRHPASLPWYRHFMFGPRPASHAVALGKSLQINDFTFQVIHTPGHSPDHICLFEPTRRWLFSGDLYVAADLDSQLSEVDGNAWISSLTRVIALRATWLFDAHGKVVQGEAEVEQLLTGKLRFLTTLRDTIYQMASEPVSVEQLTRKIFNQDTFINHLSFSDGWLSLLTSSDFTRSNIVKSFLHHPKPEVHQVETR